MGLKKMQNSREEHLTSFAPFRVTRSPLALCFTSLRFVWAGLRRLFEGLRWMSKLSFYFLTASILPSSVRVHLGRQVAYRSGKPSLCDIVCNFISCQKNLWITL